MNFLDTRPICKNCKFCELVHEYNFNSYECICRFMPIPVKKSSDDWCGQYEESELDLDYILSFDVDKIMRKSWENKK